MKCAAPVLIAALCVFGVTAALKGRMAPLSRTASVVSRPPPVCSCMFLCVCVCVSGCVSCVGCVSRLSQPQQLGFHIWRIWSSTCAPDNYGLFFLCGSRINRLYASSFRRRAAAHVGLRVATVAAAIPHSSFERGRSKLRRPSARRCLRASRRRRS